jgi:hypothetical protein
MFQKIMYDSENDAKLSNLRELSVPTEKSIALII